MAGVRGYSQSEPLTADGTKFTQVTHSDEPHIAVWFSETKIQALRTRELKNSSSKGLHEKYMMKNAVKAVWGLIMKDISSVQEVFTTNACQVMLYTALWTHLVKVPMPGCLPSTWQNNQPGKGCTGQEHTDHNYKWGNVHMDLILCHTLLSPPLTRCLIFRGWMHAELMTLMHN